MSDWPEPNLGSFYSALHAGAASTAVGFANIGYYHEVKVLSKRPITGIAYWTGTGAASGNVRSALYNSAGTKVADRTSDLAQAGASTFQQVAFDAVYTPPLIGTYFAEIWFSSSAATALLAKMFCPAGAATNAGGTHSSITPPTTAATGPVLTTY